MKNFSFPYRQNCESNREHTCKKNNHKISDWNICHEAHEKKYRNEYTGRTKVRLKKYYSYWKTHDTKTVDESFSRFFIH